MTLGETIRALRIQADISMAYIQKTVRIKQFELSAIERDNYTLTPAQHQALAKLFNIQPDELTANSAKVLQKLKPSESRLEYAQQLEAACGAPGYAMLAALDTCELANHPDLFDKNTTRYIPAIQHTGAYDDWRKAEQYFRTLATYYLTYWQEVKNAGCNNLQSILTRPKFTKTIETAMLLQNFNSRNRASDRAFCENLARFYTAFAIIDLQPHTPYDLVEQRLDKII